MSSAAPEIMKKFCPVCKAEREFIRVIAASIENGEPILDGVPVRRYIKETKLPMAYCADCKIVLYVGPSVELLQEELDEEEEDKKREIFDGEMSRIKKAGGTGMGKLLQPRIIGE
jgi:hypothetical protein